LKELIEVLFSILLIILGDYIYNEKEEKKIKTKTKIIKKRRKK
jgi:hypothetical protein